MDGLLAQALLPNALGLEISLLFFLINHKQALQLHYDLK
jgi:hypothetical protein